jgi:uncharacterized protein YdaU (DUF1376 family)
MSACDQWMPLYTGDYKRSTDHLTCRQHGAYLLLLMHHWDKGFLPDDDSQLAKIARLSSREWRTDAPVIRLFFVQENGRLIQPRLKSELDKARGVAHSRSKRENAKHWNTNGSPKKDACDRPETPRTTTATSTEEERKRSVVSVCTLVSTDSHEENTHMTDTLIPKSWMPKAEDALFAARIGLDVEQQVPLFVDWHRAKGIHPPDASAAWRNWCRIAAERAKPKLSPSMEYIFNQGLKRRAQNGDDVLEHLIPLPGGKNDQRH